MQDFAFNFVFSFYKFYASQEAYITATQYIYKVVKKLYCLQDNCFVTLYK